MSSQIQYARVEQTQLYEIKLSGNVGWAGYVLPGLPPGRNRWPASIGIAESLLLYTGHYVFSVRRPSAATADPAGFAKQVIGYVQKNAQTGNRALFWLKGFDPVEFGSLTNFGVQFSSEGFNNFVVRADFYAQLGKSVQFFARTGAIILADQASGVLRLNSPFQQFGYLGLRKCSADLGIKMGDATRESAAIPLSGGNTGCIVFNGVLTPSITFSSVGLDLGFKYITGNGDTPRSFFYPAFDAASFPSSLEVVGSVDPSDPVNNQIKAKPFQGGHLRTALAPAGDPALPSYFRTAQGRLVSLVAIGTVAGASALSARGGAFALSSESPVSAGKGEASVYLAPAGLFGISVDGQNPGSQQELMCAFFGSERLTFSTYDTGSKSNDTFLFLPGQPAFAPIFPFETASLEEPDSGGIKPYLTPAYLTSWATISAQASVVRYSAQPEGSPLYGKAKAAAAQEDDVSVLVSTPPSMVLPQGLDHLFPLLPYAALRPAADQASAIEEFESQIIGPTRKNVVTAGAEDTWSARAAARLSAPPPPTVGYATTPQGFVVQTDSKTGAYLRVQLAQSDKSGELTPFAFERPTAQLQDALQTNQLFLVAVNDQFLNDSAAGAVFDNTLYIADWKMQAMIGKGATPTSYRNVMIMKFCSGSVADRVTNPNRWTSPKDFSLLAGSDQAGLDSLAFTGLSQWLQAYIDAAIAQAEGRSADFYRNFKRIVTDPSWNGVIVLQADLSADALPAQIQGLAAGIDFTRFAAHHFGFTVSRVTVDKQTGEISMDGISSLFGLIDYAEPRYALNLDAGGNPDAPIPVQTSNDFNFTVLQLQSLFDNARLVDFRSSIQLTVDSLFGSRVLKTFGNGTAMPANGVVLDGSYIDQNGTAAYVFQQTNTSVFVVDNNVLQAVAFTRTQFNTLGERDGGATVASRFVIWGSFDFVELKGTDGQLFDIFSFGSSPGTPASGLGAGLAFSNLVIGMSFPSTTPNAQSFAFDTDNLAYDLNASSARDESLFKGFGLQLKSFINASGDRSPSDLGFLPVTTQLNLTELGKPWFGVVYQVTLGGPGALASSAGFASNFLTAWSPSTAAKDSEQAIFVGLSLPGAAPGAKLLSIEGIFKVSVGSIALLRQQVAGSKPSDQRYIYCLRLDDIGIKIFGIVKLPPDATIQFFMFGDPAGTGSLAWYAAYVATQAGGTQSSEVRLVPVQGEPPSLPA